VGPGAGGAAISLYVAAAEKEETLVLTVVAHRPPQEGAAQLSLRVGLRGEVGPGAVGGVVAEGAPAGVEDEGPGVGVVVVLRAQGEGAVDGPVGARVALGIAEAEALVLPGGGPARAEAWPPVL